MKPLWKIANKMFNTQNGVADGRLSFDGDAYALSVNAATSDVGYVSYDYRQSAAVDIDAIAQAVKKSLGFVEKPLTKCPHCGQWGAAYCQCKHCGAPMDPK